MKLRAYITEWWRGERVRPTHTIPGMKERVRVRRVKLEFYRLLKKITIYRHYFL